MRNVIRNPADRSQVALAIAGPFVIAFPFFVSLNVQSEILLWIAVWVFICRHNYILHNHVHCPFTRSIRLNRILGVMLGVCTGMTTGIWKITHVHGHHVEHKIGSLTDRGYVRYLHVDDTAPFSHFAAVCHALRTAPIQLILPLFVLARRSFSDSSFRRKFYRYYLGEAALVYGLVGIFFWLDAAKSIFYFGVIYSIVYLESRHVDYITHTFSRGDSKLSLSNVCTHPRYNKTFWNFGYHIVHHIHPAAHWTSLPAFYKQLEISEHSIPIGRRANILRLFAPATFSWHRVGERTGH